MTHTHYLEKLIVSLLAWEADIILSVFGIYFVLLKPSNFIFLILKPATGS